MVLGKGLTPLSHLPVPFIILLSGCRLHPVQKPVFLELTKSWLLNNKQGLEPDFIFSQISKTGKEIKDYVEAQAGNDPLLKGIPEDKNPFKEKGACMIS